MVSLNFSRAETWKGSLDLYHINKAYFSYMSKFIQICVIVSVVDLHIIDLCWGHHRQSPLIVYHMLCQVGCLNFFYSRALWVRWACPDCRLWKWCGRQEHLYLQPCHLFCYHESCDGMKCFVTLGRRHKSCAYNFSCFALFWGTLHFWFYFCPSELLQLQQSVLHRWCRAHTQHYDSSLKVKPEHLDHPGGWLFRPLIFIWAQHGF